MNAMSRVREEIINLAGRINEMAKVNGFDHHVTADKNGHVLIAISSTDDNPWFVQDEFALAVLFGMLMVISDRHADMYEEDVQIAWERLQDERD